MWMNVDIIIFVILLTCACEWNIPNKKAVSTYLVLQSMLLLLFHSIPVLLKKDSKYFYMTLKILILLHSLYCYEYCVTFTYSSIVSSHIQSSNTAINYLKRLKKTVRFLTFTRPLIKISADSSTQGSATAHFRSYLSPVCRKCTYSVQYRKYGPDTVSERSSHEKKMVSSVRRCNLWQWVCTELTKCG